MDYPDATGPSGSPNAVPIGGELWNVEATAAYLIRIYRAENVVENDMTVRDVQRGGFHMELKKTGDSQHSELNPSVILLFEVTL